MRIEEVNAKILEGLSGQERRNFEAGLAALNMANPADRIALREAIKRLRPDFTDDQLDIFIEGEVKPENDLEKSFVKLGLTRQQAKIAAKGDVRNLGLTQPIYGGDRGALIASLKFAHPDWTDQQIEIFLNPEGRHFTEAVDEEHEGFIARVATAYQELNPGASEEDIAKWTQDNEKRVKAKSEEEDYVTATVPQLVSAVLQDDKEKAESQEIPDALGARHPDWSAQTRAAWLKKNEPLLLAYKGLHPEWSGSQLVTAVDKSPEGK